MAQVGQQPYHAQQQPYHAQQQPYPAQQQPYPATQQLYPAQQQAYPAPQQMQHAPQQRQYVAMNQNVPTTTLFTATGTPIQIINVNTNDGKYSHYRSPAARILGILQVALGIVIFLTQIIVTAMHSEGFQGMSGFYAPVIFILAGAFGIQSSKTKSECSVITTMALSVIAAVLSIGPLTQGSIGAVLARDNYIYRSEYSSRARTAAAFHVIMLIAAIAEGIVAIVAAAYCCHGCCCHARPGVIVGQGPVPSGHLPLATGGMQMTTVTYQQNAGYHPAPLATVSNTTYQAPAGASFPAPAPSSDLPAYSAAGPPPQYKEKTEY